MTYADAVRRSRLRCRGGFTLNGVLILIVLITMLVTTSVFLTVTEERSAAAARQRARLAAAADAVVAEMQERLLARAQSVSGALWDSDLAILNAAAVLDIELADPAVRIDPARTGWRVIEVRHGERIPHDEVPLAAWTDQPRIAYAGTPPVGGLVAARTLVVAVYATVVGTGGGTYRVRRDLAISQVPPHQHALYAAGDAELCSSATPGSWIGGPVRVDGRLLALSCAHLLRYTGGVEARDGIEAAEPATHFVVGADGHLPLASVSRAEAESSPAATLAPWGGRVRVAAAYGGALGPGRLSTADVAGSGECDDVPAAGALACGGGARYYPSVQVQRITSGAGREYAAVCGAAYDEGCGDVLAAITYHPWPFAGPQASGLAAVDPAAPPYPWRGLLPDARREARCTATVGGNSYRTARCPTNLYGFRIDLAALPAVAGGLLSIRKASGQAPGANPSGAQEIVLLVNGASLAGPLTIHSEIPVYVAGNFNTAFRAAFNGPPPAKIHAPRVVVLPNEAPAQLQTSAVWDSVTRAGDTRPTAEPLRAESNVTLYAVIRSGYCRSVGGSYFGGAWEGSPAVLGDWSRAGLRVVGAVEVRDATPTVAGCAAFGAALTRCRPPGRQRCSRPRARCSSTSGSSIPPFSRPARGGTETSLTVGRRRFQDVPTPASSARSAGPWWCGGSTTTGGGSRRSLRRCRSRRRSRCRRRRCRCRNDQVRRSGRAGRGLIVVAHEEVRFQDYASRNCHDRTPHPPAARPYPLICCWLPCCRERVEELGCSVCSRMVHDLGGRTLLDDLAVCEHDHAVRDLANKLHMMRDHDHGNSSPRQVPEHSEYLSHQFRIESGGDFVEEQHLGVHHQRPCDCNALPLPA